MYHLPVAEPLFTTVLFEAVLDVMGFGLGFGNEFVDWGEFFTHGEDGNDSGDDSLNGDVGVPKLDGRDIFESEEMIEFTLIDISELSSVGSGVQRTVGSDTLCVLLIVGFCSVSGESAILFCNKDINKVRKHFKAMRQE